MKIHISETSDHRPINRKAARYAQLAAVGVKAEELTEPICLTDTTAYRVVMNCQAEANDLSTNGRLRSAKQQPLTTKEEVKT